MSLTKNPNVLKWVDEMVALCKPDKVVWIDGSKEQLDELIKEVTSLPDGDFRFCEGHDFCQRTAKFSCKFHFVFLFI